MRIKIRNTNILLITIGIIMMGCRPLNDVTVFNNNKIADYKYIFIPPTSSLPSGSGTFYGGYYGTSNKSVNPADVVTGILIKRGLIKLTELKSDLAAETLIVNYGESGKRYRRLGYTIEVTIQFVSAKNNNIVCSCTAEGQGETEADDIRQAISRCLQGLLTK